MDASNNEFEVIPEVIFKLDGLRVLCLSGNRIGHIDKDISKLKNLETLFLHDNDLESLPSQIQTLKKLQRLTLEGNPKLGISSDMLDSGFRRLGRGGSPEKLFEWYFRRNADTGALDTTAAAEIRQLLIHHRQGPSPTIIAMNHESLSDVRNFPPELFGMTDIETLVFSGVPFRLFPLQICRLDGLRVLHIDGCQLSMLPGEFANLKRLEALHASANRFDAIPECIFELDGLKQLDLSCNRIVRIDKEISRLKNLEVLALHFNDLDSLPVELKCLRKLKTLTLDGNPPLWNLPAPNPKALLATERFSSLLLKKHTLSAAEPKNYNPKNFRI